MLVDMSDQWIQGPIGRDDWTMRTDGADPVDSSIRFLVGNRSEL
jgi:hypothetical protein